MQTLEKGLNSAKERVTSALKAELSKAIHLVKRSTTSVNFKIDTSHIDNDDIDKMMHDMMNAIDQWMFRVTQCKADKTNVAKSEKVMTEIGGTNRGSPKMEFLQADKFLQDLEEKHASKTPKPERTAIGKTDTLTDRAKHYSSMRHVKPTLYDNSKLINRPLGKLDDKDKPRKDSLFEFEAEMPDPSDRNFNNFLESELEKIKKAFLEDGSPPVKEGNGGSKNKGGASLKNLSVGNNKRSSSIGNKGASIDPQSTAKQSPTQLSYKEKFEDLYYKSKSQAKINDQKVQVGRGSPMIQAGLPSLEEDLKTVSEANKVLSKYSMPHFSPNHLQTFSPLFKSD